MSSEGWKIYKLAEVAEIVGGGTPSTTNSDYWGGDIPWLTPRDLSTNKERFVSQGERNITPLGLANSSAKLLPTGTVLLTTRAPIGYLAIASNPICTNQGFKSLIPNNQMVDSLFLYYLLKNNVEYLKSVGVGTTFAEISGGALRKIEFGFPELPVQHQIAEILSVLDDKIELNRQTNATLEAIAQAIFKEWFVDFNYPGATGELVESELGMIPKGWRVGKLEEMFDFLEGPGIRNWQYTNEGIPFVNIRLIENNDINILKANFVSTNEALIKYPHFLLAEKDMIVSTSGTLGKTAIVRKSHLPLLLNTSVIRFKPTDGFSYPFMYQFLQSFRFLSELVSLASGSVQLNFGPSHLKRINIVIPPREIVLEYCNQISEVYSIIDTNLEEIISLASIRDSLLPKLMNGDMEI